MIRTRFDDGETCDGLLPEADVDLAELFEGDTLDCDPLDEDTLDGELGAGAGATTVAESGSTGRSATRAAFGAEPTAY